MPTHVVLQVGVGSMAAAVLSYLVEEAAERAAARGGQGRGAAARPIVLTLEPETAACAFESAKRADGEMAIVEGDLETMIAGLACGVPSDLAWPILWEHVDGGFFWISDGLAANGMRAAAREGVVAGECGGAPIGLLQRLMLPTDADCPRAVGIRRQLGLGPSSRVLIFNTEGATDPKNHELQMGLPDEPTATCAFGFAPPRAA